MQHVLDGLQAGRRLCRSPPLETGRAHQQGALPILHRGLELVVGAAVFDEPPDEFELVGSTKETRHYDSSEAPRQQVRP